MPKQKGIIKLKGTLNGVCYYPLNGVYISRKAVGPSKERIQTDPAFVNVKNNNQEFGGASILSKSIRQGFTKTAAPFKDTYMASRLSGVCRNIIKKGSGAFGQRDANIFNNPQALIGFQLNKNQAFNSIYVAKPIVSSHNNRNNITIKVPYNAGKQIQKHPKKATHVQFIAALSLVSKFQWQPVRNTYVPENPEYNGLGTSQETQALLCKTEHTNIQIQLQSPVINQMPTNVAITVWLGIQFLNIQGTQTQQCQSFKGMQCIAVL